MSGKSLVTQDAVVLVSGGARGITASCVIKLAERVHCKFILLGRSPAGMPVINFDPSGCDDPELKRRIASDLSTKGEKPAPARIQKVFSAIRSSQEIQSTLQAVSNAGGQAAYVQVDVTDGEALREQIAEPVSRFGQVTGIIHGAGTLMDKLIEKKSELDFETVVSPKVTGLENMLSAVEMRRLNFLVLFSSVAGFFGNVGQSDYAIANEILNKSAYLIKRKYPDCHVISFNWGPWDAGMVTPELKKVFEERHVEIIPTEVGANLLVEALTGGKDEPVQVVVGGVPVLPVSHIGPDLHQYQIRRRLTLDENPFLFDHKIGEHPVLPATCSASWVAYSCEQLYPGYRFFSIENYRVLKGIVFDENLPDEHVLDLKEVAKSDEKITFDALIWSKNKKDRVQYHYGLRVNLVKSIPEAPVSTPPQLVPTESDQVIPGQVLYENGTLFHGPSFQGVERVLHISRGKLIMQCVLPQIADRIQGQFPVYTSNPFIYDAIVQSFLIWAQYFYQSPCLPSRLQSLEQFCPIPFGASYVVTMDIVSQSETSVVGNITVQDPQGNLFVYIKGLEGTISPHLNRLIGRHSSSNT